MAKQHGNLIKMDKHPGYWLSPESGIIYWRGTVKGRRIKKSTGTTKITLAKKIIDDYMLSLTADNFKKAVREKMGVKNPLIETVWKDLVEEKGVTRAKNTLRTYQTSWDKKLGPFFGDSQVSTMSQRKIIDFEAWFLKNFPTERFFQTRKHLNALINYMHKQGYISQKPVVQDLDKVVQARSRRKTPFRVYTPGEKSQLIRAAVSLRCEVALVLYFSTGMRKMELLERKWSDINWKDKTMEVFSSKNKKWRTVPLLPQCIDVLRRWEKERGKSEYLFPRATNPNAHIIGQYFDKDWVETKRKIGLKGRARVHDIRHTFATKTSIDKWSIAVACEVLDMSPNEYIKTYVHITSSDIRKAMQESFL